MTPETDGAERFNFVFMPKWGRISVRDKCVGGVNVDYGRTET